MFGSKVFEELNEKETNLRDDDGCSGKDEEEIGKQVICYLLETLISPELHLNRSLRTQAHVFGLLPAHLNGFFLIIIVSLFNSFCLSGWSSRLCQHLGIAELIDI